MTLPARWQQTTTLATSRIIGDTDSKGHSVFRNKSNKESTTFGRVDISYGWKSKFQSGVGARYQQKSRETDGADAKDSGWSDVALFNAWQPSLYSRTWIFQTLNVPTAKSNYESQQAFGVDAHGAGTWQAGVGAVHIKNGVNWDALVSGEVHHAFGRNFKREDSKYEVGGFWGGSVTLGAGWIPWRSKWRNGVSLTPRLEGAKDVKLDGIAQNGRESLVWDTGLNSTYSLDANYALGLAYVDQTVFGPAKNTMLARSIAFLFQAHWL